MVTLTQRVSCQSRVEATCRELLRVRAPAPGMHAATAAAPLPYCLQSCHACTH